MPPPVLTGGWGVVSGFFASGLFGVPLLTPTSAALVGGAGTADAGLGGLTAMAPVAEGVAVARTGAGGDGRPAVAFGSALVASALELAGGADLPSAEEPRAAHNPPAAASS